MWGRQGRKENETRKKCEGKGGQKEKEGEKGKNLRRSETDHRK